MEQNESGKKPFKKKNNYYNKKKPTPSGEKNSRRKSESDNDYGVSSELMKKEPARNKKRFSDYSGSDTLIESFEAQEKSSGENKSARASKSATGDRKRNNAEPYKQFNSSKNADRKGKPRSNGSYNKNGRGRAEQFDDFGIKTKANNSYIPFDYSDDDIIPEDAYSYDIPQEAPRANGKKRPFKTAGEVRAESAVPGAVVGRNAVRELLRSERSVDKLYIKGGTREGSIVVIVAEAISRKIPVVEVSQEKLDQLSGGANHQGVVALAAEKQYTDIESILKIAEERGEKPLVVIADGIEDPQNLGAVIRCAECAGAHGIIIPKRRAVGLTPVVTKASAGAIEHMAIAKVSNLSDTIEKLKKAGLWIFAAEAGGTPYYEADFDVPAAIVFGSEGFGVGRLIKEKSDFTVSIPMYGHVNSLNVATASAVILCHAARIHHTIKQ